MAVPSYFHPGAAWDRLGRAHPTAQVAVVNPANGPDGVRHAGYADQVRRSQAQGLTVLGYVHTRYGARDLASVEADVDKYYEWYGVDGVFFDEASHDCSYASSYYEVLYNHVKTKGGRVVLNPGRHVPECYASVADTLVTFEGSYKNYANNYYQPRWVSGYAADRFWHLVHGAPNARAMQRAVDLSKRRRAGYVYVTPDVLPNPWDTLPPDAYWKSELAAVSR